MFFIISLPAFLHLLVAPIGRAIKPSLLKFFSTLVTFETLSVMRRDSDSHFTLARANVSGTKLVRT